MSMRYPRTPALFWFVRLSPYILTLTLLLTACSDRARAPVASASHTPSRGPVPMPVTGPAAEGPVHNLFVVTPALYSGSGPTGDAAFDQLAQLGIRTIISVDGAVPDIERATAHGMRYVHVPVGYNGLTPEQQRTIARVLRDLPGPVFVHCHHGVHRGPTAAAVASVLLGTLDNETATAFLRAAGTAPSYTGLYACVAVARPAPPEVLDAAPADFPSIAIVSGMVRTMVAIDLAYDHLKTIRAAGWRVPTDHPDLVPVAEAGRLADLLRVFLDDPDAKGQSTEFLEMLRASAAAATTLERELLGNAQADVLNAAFTRVADSCRNCHAVYRD